MQNTALTDTSVVQAEEHQMSNSSKDVGGAIVVGFLVICIILVAFLSQVANALNLPFLEVLSNARVLLLAPVMYIAVIVIDWCRVPLPLRLDNTWPWIAAALWIGIHRLTVMKIEQSAYLDDYGNSVVLFVSDIEYPWYAQSWFLWVGFIAIVCFGYWLKKKLDI